MNLPEASVGTADFFATHPVFSLDEAVRVLAPPRGRAGMVERLKYHVNKGRLMRVSRGIYAVVPRGMEVRRFSPDPFLLAVAIRPQGIFSHHSALELLGVAHSSWSQHTLYASPRRRRLRLDGQTIRFLDHPRSMTLDGNELLGTRRMERRGILISVTGPERTLIEGFHRPALTGGTEELALSASGFPVLDLDLLEDILHRYAMANLWAATGWFLETFRQRFHVPDPALARLHRRRPHAPQYLERHHRDGLLSRRWNLIIPRTLVQPGEADEP